MKGNGANRSLVVAVQAIGVYFACLGVHQVLLAVARLTIFSVIWGAAADSSAARPAGANSGALGYLFYALAYLLISSVLLAKAEWVARAADRMSKPVVDEEDAAAEDGADE